jgi:hypothetical protein
MGSNLHVGIGLTAVAEGYDNNIVIIRSCERRAVEEDRIVVSADSDFGVIIAAQEAERPSFILFPEPDLMVARGYFDALFPALPMLVSELTPRRVNRHTG